MQLFEFIGRIAQSGADGRSVRASGALFQPILAADVVAALATVTLGSPVNGIVEVGGPERFRIDDLVRRVMQSTGDAREVTTDAHARYLGAELNDESLILSPSARVGAKPLRRLAEGDSQMKLYYFPGRARLPITSSPSGSAHRTKRSSSIMPRSSRRSSSL